MGKSQAAAAADQVEDQHDNSDHDQDVDKPAANVKREAEQPQNQQNYKDCPEHRFSFESCTSGTDLVDSGRQLRFTRAN
jgi:hypothetical protein